MFLLFLVIYFLFSFVCFCFMYFGVLSLDTHMLITVIASLWIDPIIIIKYSSMSLVQVFVLKFILPNIRIATILSFVYCFYLYPSIYFHIYLDHVFIHSGNLCFWLEIFKNLFILSLVINNVGFMSDNLIFVFCMFPPFLLYCCFLLFTYFIICHLIPFFKKTCIHTHTQTYSIFLVVALGIRINILTQHNLIWINANLISKLYRNYSSLAPFSSFSFGLLFSYKLYLLIS